MNEANLEPTGPRSIQSRASGSAPARARASDVAGVAGASGPSGGSAFRALLERLQAQADELDRKSQNVADARELAGALDIARASLTDAFSLSDRLLEAFREAHLQSAPPPAREGGLR